MPQFETMWGGVDRRTDEREHYHERWDRAVAKRLVLDVYVPAPTFLHTIIGGSGIVGSVVEGMNKICIDFEGNRFGSANIVTFFDRVNHAAGRHVSAYPTIARMWVDPTDLVKVGEFECAVKGEGALTVTDQAAIDAWCAQ